MTSRQNQRTLALAAPPSDAAMREARRRGAAIVFSLVADVIAHDPPSGDPVDAALRELADELRRRASAAPPGARPGWNAPRPVAQPQEPRGRRNKNGRVRQARQPKRQPESAAVVPVEPWHRAVPPWEDGPDGS